MNKSKQFLILIRGLPGSGKTTLANEIQGCRRDIAIPSADGFFSKYDYIKLTWEYNFQKQLLKYAHMQCVGCAAYELYHGNSVIVHNTFSCNWEMEEYFELAKTLNIPIMIIQCMGQFKSIHNVPHDVIARMQSRWEDVSKCPKYFYNPSLPNALAHVEEWIHSNLENKS